jgi:hypothetical protein
MPSSCERENKWLSEDLYSVDVSMIPRGGHRRRKSMEPRALANANGNLSTANTPAKQGRKSYSPEVLNLDSPMRRQSGIFVREEFSPTAHGYGDESDCDSEADGDFEYEDGNQTLRLSADYDAGEETLAMPQTPAFMRPQNLEQKTCPPKQGQDSLFFPSFRGTESGLEGEQDQDVRRRLVLARRKSLQFAPKVGSPLGRNFS